MQGTLKAAVYGILNWQYILQVHCIDCSMPSVYTAAYWISTALWSGCAKKFWSPPLAKWKKLVPPFDYFPFFLQLRIGGWVKHIGYLKYMHWWESTEFIIMVVLSLVAIIVALITFLSCRYLRRQKQAGKLLSYYSMRHDCNHNMITVSSLKKMLLLVSYQLDK